MVFAVATESCIAKPRPHTLLSPPGSLLIGFPSLYFTLSITEANLDSNHFDIPPLPAPRPIPFPPTPLHRPPKLNPTRCAAQLRPKAYMYMYKCIHTSIHPQTQGVCIYCYMYAAWRVGRGEQVLQNIIWNFRALPKLCLMISGYKI
jgi:hypothetical protein